MPSTPDSKAYKALEKVRPSEWVRRIDGLDEYLRDPVACILWWDFFSMRLVGERWPHLDKYLPFHEHPEIPTDAIVEALIAIGYPPSRAALRMKAW